VKSWLPKGQIQAVAEIKIQSAAADRKCKRPDFQKIRKGRFIMSTPVSIAKHPIHPILVTMPIGLWVFSIVCDIISQFSVNANWGTVAFFCIAGGIVAAVLAAIPGLIDCLSITDAAAKRIATTHLVLNLTALVLFGVNLWLRYSGVNSLIPFGLSMITIFGVGIYGWAGGELVYIHRMGVQQPRRQSQSQEPMRKVSQIRGG
jgi:uncharacterized membrane protein